MPWMMTTMTMMSSVVVIDSNLAVETVTLIGSFVVSSTSDFLSAPEGSRMTTRLGAGVLDFDFGFASGCQSDWNNRPGRLDFHPVHSRSRPSPCASSLVPSGEDGGPFPAVPRPDPSVPAESCPASHVQPACRPCTAC